MIDDLVAVLVLSFVISHTQHTQLLSSITGGTTFLENSVVLVWDLFER